MLNVAVLGDRCDHHPVFGAVVRLAVFDDKSPPTNHDKGRSLLLLDRIRVALQQEVPDTESLR